MFSIEIDPSDLVRAAEEADRRGVAALQTAVRFAVVQGAVMAKNSARFKDRSGGDGARNKTLPGLVLTKPRGASGTIECRVPYASFLNEGTKAHDIYPRAASVLRWEDSGGSVVFARHVHHPGTAADGFMDRGAEEAEKVLVAEAEARVPTAIEEAFR